MIPDEPTYYLLAVETDDGTLHCVMHGPSAQVLFNSHSLAAAAWLVSVLNWADAMPMLLDEYDGSQYETDPPG